MSTNPFAAYGGTEIPPTIVPSQNAAPRSSDNADPFSAYGGSEIQSQSASPAEPRTEVEPSDPFSNYGGKAVSSVSSDSSSGVSDPDESAIGRAWDWASKPLLNLHREGAGPIESGVENFASGLTSPLSLGLLIATGGLSSLAEGAGADALESMAPEIARVVKPAANVASKLMHAGFTGQQIYSVARAVPAVSDAIKSGDYDTAERLGTEAILGGLAAYGGARTLASRLSTSAADDLIPHQAVGEHQAAVEKGNLDSRNFVQANKDLIENKPLDMAAQLYHEAGGDVSVLQDWQRQIAESPNVTDRVKGKYAAILEQAQHLPDDVKALSDKLRADYTTDWQRGQSLGTFNPEAEQPLNYAGQHEYQPNDASESTVRPTAVVTGTKSPEFTKARVFPTLKDAILAGFEPTETGLAAARARYITQFADAEGLRNAESSLQRTKSVTDSAPIGVDPSKVRSISGVDLNGKKVSNTRAIPLPDGVYHGTGAPVENITNLDAKFSQPDATGGPGIYLSRDPSVAEQYVKNNPDATVLRGTIKPDIKLLDANQPLPDTILKNSNLSQGTSYLDAVTDIRKDSDDLESAVPAIKNLQQQIAKAGYQGLDNLYSNRDVLMIFGNDILPVGSKYADLVKPSVPFDQIIKAANGKLYLDVSDYKPGPDKFNMWRIRGGEPVFNAEGNRKPIFDRANLLIHPDYAPSVQKAFQDTSWFRQSPILSKALKASTIGKKSLLAISPFHWLTEGERGLQMGLNPTEVFNPKEIDPDGLAMSKGTKYGLTLMGDKSRNLMDEGVYSDASWTHKIPLFGQLLKQSEDKLFSDYIPRLKAASYEKVVGQLSKQNPTWSEPQILTKASEITNGAFGGINWRQLGVSMASQDGLRLFMLAPDFTGSQLLFAKAGLQPGASVVWQSLARVALYNAMAAQTVNLLMNGKTDMAHPFSVDSRDGKYLYNVRTMPADLYHALTDPRSFIANRLNPVTTKPALEFLTGKDQTGRNASYGQQLSDLFQNVTPITVQGVLYKRPDQTMASQLTRGIGITRIPNRTQAQTLAIQKASARSPQGAVPQSQLDQYQRDNQMVEDLRSNAIAPQSVDQAVLSGQISAAEAQRIKKEAQQTPLVSRVSRLPLADALDVYNVATPAERAELMPEMRKKIYAYRTTARQKQTPQQIAYMESRINQEFLQ